MTNAELAAALKRRQQNRRNLKRYVHTGTMRPETARAVSRVTFSILAAAFFGVGLYFVFF